MSSPVDIDATLRNAFIWDSHAGFAPFVDLDLSFMKRWKDAGISHLAVNVGFDVMPWEETLACTAHYRRWLQTHEDDFVLAATAEDLRKAKVDGKLAVTFDLEGARALNENIEMIGVYYDLGVRHMNFAYNRNNAFGGGCHDEDIPLTDLGKQAVAEMNRVGMVVDCAHTGYRTSMDIMALSSEPTIFSHSNAFGVYEHGRNIRDEQIKACAATGGVVSVNGVSTFVDGASIDTSAILRHIDYMVSLVGTEHVGIGLDTVVDPDEMLRMARKYPDAWPNYTESDMKAMKCAPPEQVSEIARAMSTVGYSGAEIAAILGGNMLRVASRVWR